jgi:hypothetical protein
MSVNKPSAQERAAAVWQRKQVRLQRKTAQEKYNNWLYRRNELVADMVAAASWSIQPYISIADADDNESRWCLTLSTEQFSRFQLIVNALAGELLSIKAEFTAAVEKEPTRSSWLPVFLPQDVKKISFTIHPAHNSYAAEKMVELGAGDDKLILADFLSDRGWLPEKTTIRKKSGYQMPACVWYASRARENVDSHCLVLSVSAEEAAGMVSRARLRDQKRIDAIEPAATWRNFEFLYYPGGRPTSKPAKPKAPVPKSVGLSVISGGKK